MSLNVQEANSFVSCSYYSLDDVRAAWKFWREADDVDGFEAYVRYRIAESSNARIRSSLARMKVTVR